METAKRPPQLSARLQAWQENKASNAKITIRLASTVEEYRTAFKLGYEVYRREGFIPPHPSFMRVTRGHLQPSTGVLLAYCGDQVLGTLSLYPDGPAGLPSEAVWPKEIADLRAEKRRMMEFGTLLVPKEKPEMKLNICLSLFRFAWMYARMYREADTICAFVRHHHLAFYKKLLNFIPISKTPCYSCNGIEMPRCVFMCMNLDGAEEDYRKRFDHWGDSSRNLYRLFVHHEREAYEGYMKKGVRRHAKRNWRAIREEFEPYCSGRKELNPQTGVQN